MESLILTQTELLEYQQLMLTERGAKATRLPMRLELIQRLDRGAQIEPGPLVCRLTRREQMLLSRDKVVSAIGWAEFERLISLIKPTVCERFTVVAAHG